MRLLSFLIFLFFVSTIFSQTTGDIYGTVVDEKNIPVSGASVFLENTETGVQTDFDGNYRISGIVPGSFNLVVSYLGYETQTQYNIIVKSKGNPAYNFTLIEAPEALEEVVISSRDKISRPRETPLSTQTLSAVEIATYPGSNNDVVQVAQTLPGVSPSIGGFRNDLIIRGGAPNETVYYLDGMEVPNINHFSTQGSAGGPVGLVNVSFISEVTLSTSAFGAQYDNPLSGVLQFKQRNGNNRNFTGNFRVSASEAALTLEGPLFKKKNETSNTTFLASVRRSYLEFLFEAIGLPFRPNYWDYQFKLNHKIDTYNSISLIGLGSIDDFSVEAPEDFDAEQQAQLDQAPFINQRTNAIGITWQNRFRDGSGFMQTTLSNNTLNNEFTRFTDPENETGEIFNNDALESETKLRYEITKFYGEWKVKGGFNTQYSMYENNTSDLLNDAFFNTEIDFVKYGLFANATRSFLNNTLDISFGFRMDDDSFTSEDNLLSTFSPRVSLSYEFSENWKFNVSVGRYFKLPPYTILGFRNNEDQLVNQDINYTQSDHYVVGIQHYFSPSSSISLEGFYKLYDNYPVSVRDGVSLANKGGGFEILGSEPIESTGRGRSYGTELQFQQKLANNFYGIFAYTWFYSEFTGFDRDVYLPSVWDSRHLISFTGGYKLNRNWEVSARYRFAGETPFVPTELEATLANYPEVVLDYGRLGEENLDIFSQLDIRIDKKWNFDKFSFNLFIEAQNVLSQDNPQPPEYGLGRDANGQILQPRSLVEIEQDSGQIIPSLGIVVDF
ncbi:MAG: TonB-dependent receptor [Bacteroidia bacterium]|nr:TonB-dependent receptor [Bacteroidia bacterium]NNF30733.1 TonB-dependent receptor [Flavobacteriaceae bacterium]MBT8277222.1 TonB-dependent receptor [Bacteroidia bacterium]NNJ80747.1 TonB-dependent receptor [Flavobacteriaceae bacterium]NNK54822.1 TonB-dependent receptor [Flavobacteriaceae bacterium]